jgi:anthranilate phosphoribosyltransferase
MKFSIDNKITEKNSLEAIKYLFETENIAHQSIIIYQLNNFLKNTKVLLNLRNYIYKNSNKIKSVSHTLDTCGTGGDGLQTLNISTSVALLLSSIGIPIAKHGNRAASSMSGSSDIISQLNIKIENDEKKIHKYFKKNNFIYLNAPHFYPELRKVANVRKLFQTKTIFNYMGPTLNPLKAKYQLLGTFNKSSAEILNKILSNINLKNYNIFYSHDGLDEISIFSPATFYKKINGKTVKETISNHKYKKYFSSKPKFKDIKGKDPKYNADRLIELFQGKKDSYRDIVIINALHAIQLIKPNLSFDNYFEQLSYALDNNIAINHLKNLQK